jgi:glycosyltransferase involved in cell wall biosynthesis
MDCVGLDRLRGFRWAAFFVLWYWIPIRRASLISVISESTKQQLLRYTKCPENKIRVVHCPVSNYFQPSPTGFRSDRPVILQVGTKENKNLLRVAEALRAIPCHFRIIGKLHDEQVKALSNSGISYSAENELSDEAMAREYRDCDLLLFASTYEGFGLPIVESQATGRSVVTSRLLSMPEVAGDGACLVDPFDVESIRNGVLRVIHDATYRSDLIQRGYRNVERFRTETIAAKYVALYEELLGMRTRESSWRKAA